MIRFSIRDLLWATLIVALSLGWGMSYQKMNARRQEAVGQTQRQRRTLNYAKEAIDELEFARAFDDFYAGKKVDWSVLEEPILYEETNKWWKEQSAKDRN